MTKIIAIFNQAGGVAKTTLTQNLGYHLALCKHNVLLIDMDPQGSLTIFMGLVPRELEKTMYDAIVEEQPLPIYEGIHGMDLAPSNTTLTFQFRICNKLLPTNYPKISSNYLKKYNVAKHP